VTDNHFANFAFWWLGAGFILLPGKQLIFEKRKNLVFLTIFIIIFHLACIQSISWEK